MPLYGLLSAFYTPFSTDMTRDVGLTEINPVRPVAHTLQ